MKGTRPRSSLSDESRQGTDSLRHGERYFPPNGRSTRLPMEAVCKAVEDTGRARTRSGRIVNVKKIDGAPRKRVVSVETRRKIACTMLGQPKSDNMRAKVSKKLKGRVPWNKGKKMSPETRARMSMAHVGRSPWNKGHRLTIEHRNAIAHSAALSSRNMSSATRKRMQMARRRPGDAIVGGYSEGKARKEVGSFPLVDSADINDYVTLRRELRIWSDSFVERNSKRPNLADVRRVAPVPIVRKFERYVRMRDRIRGLASDVYGSIDPATVPGVAAGSVSDRPSNNNSQTVIRVTKHGNLRLASGTKHTRAENVGFGSGGNGLEGSTEDMWDVYDRPQSPVSNENTVHCDSLMGAHEMTRKSDQLSANDYRMIGKYRLMETMDINKYMSLRKELQGWSAAFRERHGRTPALSDAKSSGKSMLYNRFCEYLGMRDRMSGLVHEVYGTEMDDMEAFDKVNAEGRVILDTLRASRGEHAGPKSRDDNV